MYKDNQDSIFFSVVILFPSLASLVKFWKEIKAIVASMASIVITIISSTSVKAFLFCHTLAWPEYLVKWLFHFSGLSSQAG